MYEVKVEKHFSSAHKLREYKGRCENLHGHNWKVEVSVKSKSLDKIGLVVDFRELKEKLTKVLKALDHTYLNELDYFKKINPTSENIAKYVFDSLKSQNLTPSKVIVWESEGSSASYSE